MRLEPSNAARQAPLLAIPGNAALENPASMARGFGAAGQMALAELEISLGRSWRSMARATERAGTAARIVEEEEHRLRFLGDAGALDRLDDLSRQVLIRRPESTDSYVLAVQVATLRRRYAEARVHLRSAQSRGASEAVLMQLGLNLQQATGENPPAVLARRRLAAASGSIPDLAALAGLLEEFGEAEEAEQAYQSIQRRRGLSPFVLAWACFRLAMICRERTVPSRAAASGTAVSTGSAAHWLGQALGHLPRYAEARLQMADLRLAAGELAGAEAALRSPAMNENDPEVGWRLASLLSAQGCKEEAEHRLDGASAGFDALLQRHELAFAEPAARFFLKSGRDPLRAFELARNHLANQPTLSAFELAHAAAAALPGEARAAIRIAALARARWGHARAFAGSTLERACASLPSPAALA